LAPTALTATLQGKTAAFIDHRLYAFLLAQAFSIRRRLRQKPAFPRSLVVIAFCKKRAAASSVDPDLFPISFVSPEIAACLGAAN
jgi:hypothetical protein